MLSGCDFFPTATLCKEGARFAELTVLCFRSPKEQMLLCFGGFEKPNSLNLLAATGLNPGLNLLAPV